MAANKQSDKEKVTQHIESLPQNLKSAVEHLRQIILSVDPEIAEHIKWNSPAFYYSGVMKDFDPKEYKRDILVMNLRNNKLMCVLPTGMTIKENTEILEGDYTDGRRMMYFEGLVDIVSKEEKIKAVITEWISLIEK